MNPQLARELVAEARSLVKEVRDDQDVAAETRSLARAVELVALAVAALAGPEPNRG